MDDINATTTVESILRVCGVQGRIADMGGYYQFSSPFHEDRHPSMVLYKDNLYCIDFSGDFKGSLSRFMKITIGQSLYRYLGMSQKEKDDRYYMALGKQARKERESTRSLGNTSTGLDAYEIRIDGKIDHDLTHNSEVLAYAKSRFINEEFATFFNLAWTERAEIQRIVKGRYVGQKGTLFEKRLLIPISRDGYVTSIEGRDYTRKQPKKCIYPRGGDVSSLFNIDNLRKDEPLILVEGVMDMVRIWEYISKNVAPVFGIQITGRQKELIKTFPDVIVFSDSDESGEKMIDIVDSFYEDREFRVARLAKGDPGDVFNTVDDLKRAIDNAMPCNEYFMRKHGLIEPAMEDDKAFFAVC